MAIDPSMMGAPLGGGGMPSAVPPPPGAGAGDPLAALAMAGMPRAKKHRTKGRKTHKGGRRHHSSKRGRSRIKSRKRA